MLYGGGVTLVLSLVAAAHAQPVELTLVYESLCPGCEGFITRDLKAVWSTEGFPDILKLNMLPYGNARDQGGQVACQHGPAECKLNMVEACGIKHLPTAKEYMPFIFCVESGAKDGTPDALIRSCTEENSTAKLISDCYGEGSGGEGAAAIAAVGQQTAALGHQYTPWVVIDGQHSKSGESGLKQAICDAYKGAARPSACQGDAEHHTVSKCFPDGTVVVV